MLGSISSTPIEARSALSGMTGKDEVEWPVSYSLDRRQSGLARVGRNYRAVQAAIAQACEKLRIGQVFHQIERRVRQRLGEFRQGDRQR